MKKILKFLQSCYFQSKTTEEYNFQLNLESNAEAFRTIFKARSFMKIAICKTFSVFQMRGIGANRPKILATNKLQNSQTNVSCCIPLEKEEKSYLLAL